MIKKKINIYLTNKQEKLKLIKYKLNKNNKGISFKIKQKIKKNENSNIYLAV